MSARVQSLELHREEGAEDQRRPVRMVYSQAPFLIYWELTRACDLACRHCRAEAIARRDPRELTTSEAKGLLEKLRGFGGRGPHLVLTGGDPLKRPDFFYLLEYGKRLGLHVSVAPSGTQALSQEVLQRFKACGVESIGLSLDGSTAERHDSFRGVPGCFAWTIEAAQHARAEGLPLQVNTLVTAETEADIPDIYKLVRGLSLMRWSLFYLIGVGRGGALREVSPEQCEALHHWLYGISKDAPFIVATTEAPHFRRVAIQKLRAEGIPLAGIRGSSVGKGFGIRDGNGVMFISHTGDVYPSGFLPLVAGNVRTADVVEIYRHSEVFQNIRQTTTFKGKCGQCEFREVCGGSRARAYATSGDPLESDPLCAYEPNRFEAAWT
ncbi:MAG: TIGR04053 family radical SAM/SPASM domain-containing protein [Deltaproteobacteria bacterium]|nr:TIGR04053 family radical SAM/SPASM domain-containing protein [Deltaproteobacteria bacterium]MCZ6621560.1 TIGR04053 family radical SAM/SPASM domain-containing protein [Deltaproteobacteria bacterium]MCZ6906978.1 TIGR04053 family radical SAM/SPASM domain-containing protein [Deltaproteobacteria bacterium]